MLSSLSFSKKSWSRKEYEDWLKKNNHLLGGAMDKKESKGMFHVFSDALAGEGFEYESQILKANNGKPILAAFGQKNNITTDSDTANTFDNSNEPSGAAMGLGFGKDDSTFEQLNPLEPAPVQSLDTVLKTALNEIKPIEVINTTGGQGVVALDQMNSAKVQHEYDYMKNAYWDQFGPDTLIGQLMKPKAQGGPGFPFPTGNSIFSP